MIGVRTKDGTHWFQTVELAETFIRKSFVVFAVCECCHQEFLLSDGER